MPKFVYAYVGGGGMPETEEEQQAVMNSWMNWMGGLGDAMLDPGNPFGASMVVTSDGSVREGGSLSLGGYSIVDAADLTTAAEMAKGCPVLQGGGSVEVYETVDVM